MQIRCRGSPDRPCRKTSKAQKAISSAICTSIGIRNTDEYHLRDKMHYRDWLNKHAGDMSDGYAEHGITPGMLRSAERTRVYNATIPEAEYTVRKRSDLFPNMDTVSAEIDKGRLDGKLPLTELYNRIYPGLGDRIMQHRQAYPATLGSGDNAEFAAAPDAIELKKPPYPYDIARLARRPYKEYDEGTRTLPVYRAKSLLHGDNAFAHSRGVFTYDSGTIQPRRAAPSYIVVTGTTRPAQDSQISASTYSGDSNTASALMHELNHIRDFNAANGVPVGNGGVSYNSDPAEI